MVLAIRLFFAGKSGTGRRVRQKETAMLVFERKTNGSFFRQLISVVSVALFMAPSVTNAEQLLLLYNAGTSLSVPETARQTVKRPVDICLNENGDLVIQRGDVSLTMAYSPPDGIIEPQERIRIAQRQNCPSISGISLKVSFLF
jgi:hypothetical protein